MSMGKVLDDFLLEESDEDLMLLDDDSETESLTSSTIELLDSESLGSLKDLLKSSTKRAADNIPPQQQQASPPPPAVGPKTTHVMKKCNNLNKYSRPQSTTVTKSIKSQGVLKTKLSRKRPVPVTTMPDLREVLNRKKRKSQLGMETVTHNNIFPSLPVGIELNFKTLNGNPFNHKYSLDHL